MPFNSGSPSEQRSNRPWWRRLGGWFSWFVPRRVLAAISFPGPTPADLLFAEPASGKPEDDPRLRQTGPRRGLGPAVLRPSSRPPSPLAEAYARSTHKPGAPATGPAAQQPLPDCPGAAWQVREPLDRSDPTPHEECLVLMQQGWRLLAASRRGKFHAHHALWREDAYQCCFAGPWALIAVADGAGTAPLARVGSRIACDSAVRLLQQELAGLAVPPTGPSLEAADLEPIRQALIRTVHGTRQALTAEAERRGQPLREFHTTLLLACHRPALQGDLVAAIQVGDGLIGVCSDRGACSVLGTADHGSFAGETQFLTTPGLELDLPGRVRLALVERLETLVVATDGVADDFFPETQRLKELLQGQAIAELRQPDGAPLPGLLAAVATDPDPGQRLLSWLRYEKRGSADDRTVALLHTHPEASP